MQERNENRIPLKNIEADPNQPRKHFDEEALASLARSISQYDVIEPIMVRPIKSKNKGRYMIVAGERRFRAAGMAMLLDIPATVRDLTDGEALEIQITENLQRENVNPMEEAEALQNIIKSGQYKAKELAARIGKRTEYVLQRTKLCDLIPAFQDLVYADKMLLSQANAICRFSADVQQTFFESYVPKDWKEKPTSWKLREVHFGNTTHNLDAAPFETEDPKLYPKMGACNGCRFNSFVSQLPFEGQENKRICSNPGCYEIKVKNAFHQKVKEVAEDDDVLFVAGWSYSEESKKRIEAAQATGKPVLAENQYKVLKTPEPPKALADFDTYKAKNEWNDDATEEDMQADYKYQQEEYEEELQDYQEELKEYEEKRLYAKKAYVVTGHRDEGQMIEVYVPSADATPASQRVKEEIHQLQVKEKNAAYKAEVTFIKEEASHLTNEYMLNEKDGPLELSEWLCIFTLLYEETSSQTRHDINIAFGDAQNNASKIISDVLLTGQTGPVFKWIRIMMVKQLVHDRSFEFQPEAFQAVTAVVKTLAGRFVPKSFNEHLEAHKEKQKARKQKVEEKIAALRQTEIPVDV